MLYLWPHLIKAKSDTPLFQSELVFNAPGTARAPPWSSSENQGLRPSGLHCPLWLSLAYFQAELMG